MSTDPHPQDISTGPHTTQRISKNLPSYPCLNCGQIFKNLTALDKHLTNAHKNEEDEKVEKAASMSLDGEENPDRDQQPRARSRRERKSRDKFQRNSPRKRSRPKKENKASPTISQHPSSLQESSSHNTTTDDDAPVEKDPVLFNQPITKPISQEQLIAEVKGIYAGLVMVEAKCIEVDSRQARAHAISLDQEKRKPLNNEQWQALIALHRTLLHEHHDFFLASQHPAASDSLKRLANKYAMPARMWRHGIHSFLELLRHRLPESFEHMLSFLYLSYSMMALLYETVPNFADTWVECLGDLGRYRMAIEEGDIRDREVWTNVSRGWYSKGSDRCPGVGRLYHHQAILSRPNVLQQLFYYSKSLTVTQPFSSARESILTLFEPFVSQRTPIPETPAANDFDNIVIKVSSIIFQCINLDDFEDLRDAVLDKLEPRIDELASKFKVQGVYVAVSCIAGIFQFGSKTGLLRGLLKEEFESRLPPSAKEQSQAPPNLAAELPPKNREQLKREHHNVLEAHEGSLGLSGSATDMSFIYAVQLTCSIFQTILLRQTDPNCHCYVHANLIFLNFLLDYPKAMAMVVYEMPWGEIAEFANGLLKGTTAESAAKFNEIEEFPSTEKSTLRPLTDDYLLRGLEMTKGYFPKSHFAKQLDEEERLIELPSMAPVRVERILWLIMRISKVQFYFPLIYYH